ncbi:uncharacterized protein LOC117178730 [Belonocnema kinseyi]|uniref:uncharacterized protein LOC117178730 n=1 Tax=Belonocnema kinseyi TaxID=2817044 RepID=UPI00143CD1F0|nr:uncharacterized protein LOC117178730 [Belonocnema kinseyi]
MEFTGIATTLLPQGKTAHKTFGIPVRLFSDSVSRIKTQSKNAKYLREIDIFIWDEAPAAPRYALELLYRTLRDFMNVDSLFDGEIIILGGNFRQLLPVQTHAIRSEKYEYFTTRSRSRKVFIVCGDGTLYDYQNYLIAPEKCVATRTEDIV